MFWHHGLTCNAMVKINMLMILQHHCDTMQYYVEWTEQCSYEYSWTSGAVRSEICLDIYISDLEFKTCDQSLFKYENVADLLLEQNSDELICTVTSLYMFFKQALWCRWKILLCAALFHIDCVVTTYSEDSSFSSYGSRISLNFHMVRYMK